MKIYICDNGGHHKNVESIHKMMSINMVEYTFQANLNKLNETYDLVICTTDFFSPDSFPTNCKVIYGPQFFVFPDNRDHPIHAYQYDSSRFFYNTLSNWNSTIFKTFAPTLSLTVITCPFGIDFESILPVPALRFRSKILIYFKNRNPIHLSIIANFLKSKDIAYEIFCYGSYSDSEFKKKLRETLFVIWIGSHESQGFAFQETQASNVPILLWNVQSMYDEFNGYCIYQHYKSSSNLLLATTANCWSDECGIQFYHEHEISTAFDLMNTKLESFTPRSYVESRISLKESFNNLLQQVGLTQN